MQSVKASTNPSSDAFKIAPPFCPNTDGSSVLWNTLKVVWPKAAETIEVNQMMYFMLNQPLAFLHPLISTNSDFFAASVLMDIRLR